VSSFFPTCCFNVGIRLAASFHWPQSPPHFGYSVRSGEPDKRVSVRTTTRTACGADSTHAAATNWASANGKGSYPKAVQKVLGRVLVPRDPALNCLNAGVRFGSGGIKVSPSLTSPAGANFVCAGVQEHEGAGDYDRKSAPALSPTEAHSFFLEVLKGAHYWAGMHFASRPPSMLPDASVSGISCTPAVGPALLAHAGSGLADTVDHYPAHATAHTGLRDHTVRLKKQRWCHSLRRCCDG
jgi:hypothetical protein